jgi:hypothetical protein
VPKACAPSEPQPFGCRRAARTAPGSERLLVATGAGSVGKTTPLALGRRAGAEGGAPGAVRGRGPGEPRAGDHSGGAHEPPGFEPARTARWREDFVALAPGKGAGAAADFGGGGATPGRLVAGSPDLPPILGEAGVSPVAADLLGPRLAASRRWPRWGTPGSAHAPMRRRCRPGHGRRARRRRREAPAGSPGRVPWTSGPGHAGAGAAGRGATAAGPGLGRGNGRAAHAGGPGRPARRAGRGQGPPFRTQDEPVRRSLLPTPCAP